MTVGRQVSRSRSGEHRLLQVEDLRVQYSGNGGAFGRARTAVRAVDGVSFGLRAGEVFGLAGESGCGKSTLGRALVRLVPAASGRVYLDGEDVLSMRGARLAAYRRDVQLIFQDSVASLDPRLPVAASIAEPLAVAGVDTADERMARVEELLGIVGLTNADGNRYPHRLSGGQVQRVGIARALAARPRLLVADEPVSALDVSVQAQILSLFQTLRTDLGLTMIFITHDLAVMRHIADRVGVMYLGTLVEIAPRGLLFESPHHPYTQALISAVPVPDPSEQRSRRRIILRGEPPSLSDPPSGCRFRTRCPIVESVCERQAPELRFVAEDHAVACHFARPDPIASRGAGDGS